MKTYFWFNQNRLLSHLRRSFSALAIVGASFPLLSAGAGTRTYATGNFFPCFNYLSAQFLPAGSGPTNFITALITFKVTADITSTTTFNGSLAGSELDVVHSSDGSIDLEGTLVFKGSLNGGPSGEMIFSYTGKGNKYTGSETLHIVGSQGTGGLAGVYFEGTAQGNVGGIKAGCAIAGNGTWTGYIISVP